MQELRDRVAVVTGGASGIGLGMATAFAAEGMKLVLADIEAEPLEQAVAGLRAKGAAAIGVATDVSEAAALETLRDRTLAEYGAVHVLCNNAGVSGGMAPLWAVPDDEWRWVLGVNLMGVVHGIRSFVPPMLDQHAPGHVVNTASMAGLVHGGGVYGISKHAVVALSESLFRQLQTAQSEIGVSVLCPGWVRTRIVESGRNRPGGPPSDPGPSTPLAEEARRFVASRVESGLDPVDVGRLVVEALRERRFYVLTHPHWKSMIEHRMRTILEQSDPMPVPPPEER